MLKTTHDRKDVLVVNCHYTNIKCKFNRGIAIGKIYRKERQIISTLIDGTIAIASSTVSGQRFPRTHSCNKSIETDNCIL
jgi:hypothetical protein